MEGKRNKEEKRNERSRGNIRGDMTRWIEAAKKTKQEKKLKREKERNERTRGKETNEG